MLNFNQKLHLFQKIFVYLCAQKIIVISEIKIMNYNKSTHYTLNIIINYF